MQQESIDIINSKKTLNDCESSIIRRLLYFDLFNYPLTKDELINFSDVEFPDNINLSLASLLNLKMISEEKGMYFLNEKNDNVAHRKLINNRALEYFHVANYYTKLIAKFPFVRGVLITGSLSKRCMHENGDIDYLIITEPGRLWICRFFLTAFKKIFLFNSRKYFCVNYYVGLDSLHIPDHNIFTATEILSAQPAYNIEVCNLFFEANSWTRDYYPHLTNGKYFQIHEKKPYKAKNILEKVFGKNIGETADSALMKLFVWRWKSKFKGEDKKRFELNFRSDKNVSKHHPNGFQFKVLRAFEENCRNFEKQHNVTLT